MKKIHTVFVADFLKTKYMNITNAYNAGFERFVYWMCCSAIYIVGMVLLVCHKAETPVWLFTCRWHG